MKNAWVSVRGTWTKHQPIAIVVLFLALQMSPLHAAEDKTIIQRGKDAELSFPGLLLARLQHAEPE